MSELIYYFDLGNTRCKVWRCRGRAIEAYWAEAHKGDMAAFLNGLPEAFAWAPRRVLIVSVLGEGADLAFSSAVLARWGLRPEFAKVGPSFQGIENAYREEPGKLGVDRWLGLIGAAGECDVLCVVGCGTAITIDVLSHNRHLGGYILPGLGLMADSLLKGTKGVRFDGGASVALALGTDTGGAVRNGVLSAVVALVERVAAMHGVEHLVITGGDGGVVAAALSIACEFDPELLLKGMMRFFEGEPGASDGAGVAVG